MSEIKNDQLIFVDEKGDEILCDILFTYDSEEFKKSYVFFVPVSTDEEESVEVAVASYVEKDGGIGDLQQVETDEEWEMLAEVFDSYACESDCDCEECDECDEEEECGCCCCHHDHE